MPRVGLVRKFTGGKLTVSIFKILNQRSEILKVRVTLPGLSGHGIKGFGNVGEQIGLVLRAH